MQGNSMFVILAHRAIIVDGFVIYFLVLEVRKTSVERKMLNPR